MVTNLHTNKHTTNNTMRNLHFILFQRKKLPQLITFTISVRDMQRSISMHEKVKVANH